MSRSGLENVEAESSTTRQRRFSAPSAGQASAQRWQSEAFHEAASKQLKALGKLLVHAKQIDLEHAGPLVADQYASPALRPEPLEIAFRDRSIVVRRAATVRDHNDEPAYRGAAGFASALRLLAAPLDGCREQRFKFKQIGVRLQQDTAETTDYFQFSGRNERGVVQINATWHCRWTREKIPRLLEIRAAAYEEITPSANGRLYFVEATPSVLAHNESYTQQLRYGYDHWRARSDRNLGSDLAGNQGLAIGDVNGDGLDDLYLLQPGGLPNRLFLHRPDGTADDISSQSRVDYLDFSRSALLVDLDNDGDQDLVVGLGWGVVILENDGQGRFTERAAVECQGSVYSLSAVDYDVDGDLDLYVCGRYASGSLDEETRVQGLPVPYHDANNGGPSTLLQNRGAWKFVDVTKAVGLDANNRRFTLAAAWEDYDRDGDPDLYVANDFGRNNLYRNDGAKGFVDVAAEAGVEDIGAGMSVSWGDYNNDGWMDLYVANMFSAAGHRITSQARFMAGASQKTLSEFQRHARGNSLFLNLGNGKFRDVTIEAKVNMGRWAWGSNFIDLNNDGLEDIVVANGFITTSDPGDL